MSVSGLDILIVEDQAFQREMLRAFLIKEGHRINEAENGEEALRLLNLNFLDLILVDFKMPGINGLEVLKEAKRLNPELDVVIMTAYGTIETAVAAMKAGARDYITKPIDLDELSIVISRIADHRGMAKENEILRQQLKAKGTTPDAIKYKSRKIGDLINIVGRIAPSQASVLIQGETGTGKELFARLIHNASSRAERPFITVNCAAIPEMLLESELFGHERGAFTGAVQRRIGRFEQADGGTLFLDEIGELNPHMQVKLLRFLQDHEFQRVGGEKTLKADARIISATNQDLDARVKEGSFREDLFYRINVVAVRIPPLRERREDIPILIDHFIKRFVRENHKKIIGISREAEDLLVKYDYPGNVRELENIIERGVVISQGSILGTKDLPFQEAPGMDVVDSEVHADTLHRTLETLERKMIREALDKSGLNQTRAAKLLGLSERMLRYKLKKYGLK